MHVSFVPVLVLVRTCVCLFEIMGLDLEGDTIFHLCVSQSGSFHSLVTSRVMVYLRARLLKHFCILHAESSVQSQRDTVGVLPLYCLRPEPLYRRSKNEVKCALLLSCTNKRELALFTNHKVGRRLHGRGELGRA